MIAGGNPFKTPEDWKRYSERWDYTGGVASRRRGATASEGATLPKSASATDLPASVPKSASAQDLQKTIEVVGLDDFRDSVANGCVWLDYASIPQRGSHAHSRAISKSS